MPAANQFQGAAEAQVTPNELLCPPSMVCPAAGTASCRKSASKWTPLNPPPKGNLMEGLERQQCLSVMSQLFLVEG